MTRKQVLVLVVAFLATVGVFAGGFWYRAIEARAHRGSDVIFVESPADASKDFIVDVRDLGIVTSQLGRVGEGLRGDVNKDGKVDESDLELVKREITVISPQ